MDTKSQKPVVLITGIEGLIGSNLAKWILDNHPEYDVVGVDVELGGLRDNADPRIEHIYKLDLTRDFFALDTVVFEHWKPEYVFHMAAFASEGLSPFARRWTFMHNCIATNTIVNLCIKHNVKKLVFASSMAVYGESHGQRYQESDLCDPIDPYGVSKLACEQDIRVANKQHGMRAAIVRPHNVYGPGQNIFDPYRNVFGIWMYNILHGKPITIYGDGKQERCFTYVEDIIRPLWNAAIDDSNYLLFNLGDTSPIRIKDAAEMLKEVVAKDGYNPEIVYLEPRYEVKQACPDGYLSRSFGYNDTTPLKRGLKRMWKWAKELPDRPLQKWNYFELDKGIYSYWKNHD